MKYFNKINGERIYLSPINTGDAELYTKWLNDPAVSTNLGFHNTVLSLGSEQKVLESLASSGYNFAIILKDGERLLGNVSLMELNQTSRTATAGIFIGDEDMRSKGLGAEALRLITNYGFNSLNLQNIMLTVNSCNEQAITCYEKVGFAEFGRRKNAVYIDGVYHDLVYMQLLNNQ